MNYKKSLFTVTEILKNTVYMHDWKKAVPDDTAVLLDLTDKESQAEIWVEKLLRQNYRIYLTFSDYWKTRLGGHHYQIHWVNRNGYAYRKLLSTAVLLISDRGLPERFTQKQGQIYLRIAEERLPDGLTDRQYLKSSEGVFLQQDYLKADALLVKGTRQDKIPFFRLLKTVWKGEIFCPPFDKRTTWISQFCEYPYMIFENNKKSFQKENVLLYAAAFIKNGMTTSLQNLLRAIDLTKRNYILCFSTEMPQSEQYQLDILPEDVLCMAFNKKGYSLFEFLSRYLYFYGNVKNHVLFRSMDEYYSRQFAKGFSRLHIDLLIHYTGYDTDMIRLFAQSPGHKAIYVHNDMLEEIRYKSNQHLETLESMYPLYDKVVAVTEDILPHTRQIGGSQASYAVVNNIHDAAGVRFRSEQKLIFTEETKSTHTPGEVQTLLDSGREKFITIGRFSAEKGHKMLIRAFDRYHEKYPDSCLFIVGGYGDMYQETLDFVRKRNLSDCVVLIQSLRNPMPLLARCDLFLLSSYYEGLGLVLLEADCLGIPVISTDVTGPAGFMKKYGGCLVKPSAGGLYRGMMKYHSGQVKQLQIDYDEYNADCVAQFENLITSILKK